MEGPPTKALPQNSRTPDPIESHRPAKIILGPKIMLGKNQAEPLNRTERDYKLFSHFLHNLIYSIPCRIMWYVAVFCDIFML